MKNDCNGNKMVQIIIYQLVEQSTVTRSGYQLKECSEVREKQREQVIKNVSRRIVDPAPILDERV